MLQITLTPDFHYAYCDITFQLMLMHEALTLELLQRCVLYPYHSWPKIIGTHEEIILELKALLFKQQCSWRLESQRSQLDY
jgi:hypothetical protein